MIFYDNLEKAVLCYLKEEGHLWCCNKDS